MSNDNTGFAGLPPQSLAQALAAQDASALTKQRSYMQWTLPADLVGEDFMKEFSEADLTFRMVDLMPKEQEDAAELGGDSGARIAREMLFASMHRIGNWNPRKDRDRLEDWWNSIGPRCTGLVQAAYVKMQSVEAKDVAMFLESGTKGRG